MRNFRLAVSKLSPINDTLDFCVKHVDENNVEEVVDGLIEVVKRGVGMSTRVGYVPRSGLNEVFRCSGPGILRLNSGRSTLWNEKWI